MKVLIVEDDVDVAEMVRSGLAVSHTVEVANDGADGSFLARSYEYDAIVLDYSLPKKDGLQALAEIRKSGRLTPVIFLSATDEVETKIKALDNGADDYMTKPFSMNELEARLRALARRPANITDTVFKVDDLVLDTTKHAVTRGETSILLTRKEFNLLEYLMRNSGRVLSRAQIMEHVWTADNDPFSNTVEAHMRNVRKKITPPGKKNLIANIPGRGYIIDSPANLSGLLKDL